MPMQLGIGKPPGYMEGKKRALSVVYDGCQGLMCVQYPGWDTIWQQV